MIYGDVRFHLVRSRSGIGFKFIVKISFLSSLGNCCGSVKRLLYFIICRSGDGALLVELRDS